MRDQFVGDVGDFGKYILLNELSKMAGGRLRVGINWYYNTAPMPVFRYLYDREFKTADPQLHGRLKAIVESNNLNLARIEEGSVLPEGFMYYSEEIPHKAASPPQREKDRGLWFKKSVESLKTADVVFLDPDNGIPYPVADNIFKPRIKKSERAAIKYAFADEIRAYYESNKSVIVYNHRDFKDEHVYRRKFECLMDGIKPSYFGVVRFHRVQVRDYIFLSRQEHSAHIKDLISKIKSKYSNLFE